MNWTKEPPQEPGWYWWRCERVPDPLLVRVGEVGRDIWHVKMPVSYLTGEEWGPRIPGPEEENPLEAENARLRKALDSALDGLAWISTTTGGFCVGSWESAINSKAESAIAAAREAMKPK